MLPKTRQWIPIWSPKQNKSTKKLFRDTRRKKHCEQSAVQEVSQEPHNPQNDGPAYTIISTFASAPPKRCKTAPVGMLWDPFRTQNKMSPKWPIKNTLKINRNFDTSRLSDGPFKGPGSGIQNAGFRIRGPGPRVPIAGSGKGGPGFRMLDPGSVML